MRPKEVTWTKLRRHWQEINTWPCYRGRWLGQLGYSFAKLIYRLGQVKSPTQLLELAGFHPGEALEGFERWERLLRVAAERIERAGGNQGAISYEDGLILYGLVRGLKPRCVVETGTGPGLATSFLGAALVENRAGELYTIDLPVESGQQIRLEDGGALDWPARGLGWAIPAPLRKALGTRLKMLRGDVREVLPKLLGTLPALDLFFHDDLHTPSHMLWEYELVWPYLSPGGILISDDANFAWLRFCWRVGLRRYASPNWRRLTLARKPGDVPHLIRRRVA